MPRVDAVRTNGTAKSIRSIDQARIVAGVRLILEGIGEDANREGLRDTADRVARMYAEVFRGLYQDPRDYLTAVFDEDHDEMVVVKDVPFYSMCEHHLLPFHGKAHVAYLPSGKVLGLSKIARVVEAFAQRPQVQERLTSQIADLLMTELDALGVAVVIEATHSCMTMRGVKKPGASMITSAMRGNFKTNLATRSEFMSLIHSSQQGDIVFAGEWPVSVFAGEWPVSRDTIQIHNMQFYGRHGVNPEEKVLGQRFEVDVELDLDTRPAGLSDDLTQTINYAHVYRLVKRLVEEECFDLIEALAETIATHVGREFGPDAVRVRVRKPHAPIKGVLDYVAVAIERTPKSWQSPT